LLNVISCKRNVITYNLPEKPDQATDKAQFTEMHKEITDAELKIAKFFRLGKRVENKACLLSVAP